MTPLWRLVHRRGRIGSHHCRLGVPVTGTVTVGRGPGSEFASFSVAAVPTDSHRSTNLPLTL